MTKSTKTKLKSPLSALFLLKFDVRTGYTIEWSKSINDSISLRGIEFKALPSGLHQSSKDVIAFVEDQDDLAFPGKLIYGISVFKSNLEDEGVDDRARVRMYSLGLLIIPQEEEEDEREIFDDDELEGQLRNGKNNNIPGKKTSLVWRPLTFTSGWEYIKELEILLGEWLLVPDDDLEKYKILEEFFNDNKQQTFLLKENDLLLTGDNNNDDDDDDDDETSKENDSETFSTNLNTIHTYNQSHHMLLSLIPLMENFGPLIFKIWKLALLRKKMIVHNSGSIQLNCSDTYCISVISTIPHEILPILIESGVKNIDDLQYYQPLYNVGVNDIQYLETIIKNFNPGFIASTTDEILLYKPILYDYSVKLSSSNDSLPQITTAIEFPRLSNTLKATQRDLGRFQILYDEFDLYLKDCYLEDELKWWLEVCEPTSWKEFIWKGISWWATLGENDHSKHDLEIDREGLGNIGSFTDDEDSIYTSSDLSKTTFTGKTLISTATQSSNNDKNNKNDDDTNTKIRTNEISKEVIDVLKIVGYFQNMTVKIFQILVDIINNDDLDDSSMVSNGQSSSSNNDNNINQQYVVYISLSDINEMGLDPYSLQDHEFIVELVNVWWGKEAKVGSYLGNLCC